MGNIPPEMFTAAWILTVTLAWAVGFSVGLWLGERGRRLDAQEREGVLANVRRRPPAEVKPPGGWEAEGTDRELVEPPESFLVQTIAETGCSREEAIEEWRLLLSKSLGDGGGSGWMQESP